MRAVKGNKAYTVTDTEKESYKKQGYDIIDDDGKVVENGVGKSVSYEKYKELEVKYTDLQNTHAALENDYEELKISNMTVDQLKAYATDRKVDLGDATTKEAILAKFKEALGISINSNAEQPANEPK